MDVAVWGWDAIRAFEFFGHGDRWRLFVSVGAEETGIYDM